MASVGEMEALPAGRASPDLAATASDTADVASDSVESPTWVEPQEATAKVAAIIVEAPPKSEAPQKPETTRGPSLRHRLGKEVESLAHMIKTSLARSTSTGDLPATATVSRSADAVGSRVTFGPSSPADAAAVARKRSAIELHGQFFRDTMLQHQDLVWTLYNLDGRLTALDLFQGVDEDEDGGPASPERASAALSGDAGDSAPTPPPKSPTPLQGPEPPEDPAAYAFEIFSGTAGLRSRKDVAGIIGGSDAFAAAVRDEYMRCFDFGGYTLVDAFRYLCSVLFITGETQVVDRILMAFARRFYGCNVSTPLVQRLYLHQEVVYILLFSMVLLNTDLHVVEGGAKMRGRDFVRNTIETVQAAAASAVGEAALAGEAAVAAGPGEGETPEGSPNPTPTPTPNPTPCVLPRESDAHEHPGNSATVTSVTSILSTGDVSQWSQGRPPAAAAAPPSTPAEWKAWRRDMETHLRGIYHSIKSNRLMQKPLALDAAAMGSLSELQSDPNTPVLTAEANERRSLHRNSLRAAATAASPSPPPVRDRRSATQSTLRLWTETATATAASAGHALMGLFAPGGPMHVSGSLHGSTHAVSGDLGNDAGPSNAAAQSTAALAPQPPTTAGKPVMAGLVIRKHVLERDGARARHRAWQKWWAVLCARGEQGVELWMWRCSERDRATPRPSFSASAQSLAAGSPSPGRDSGGDTPSPAPAGGPPGGASPPPPARPRSAHATARPAGPSGLASPRKSLRLFSLTGVASTTSAAASPSYDLPRPSSAAGRATPAHDSQFGSAVEVVPETGQVVHDVSCLRFRSGSPDVLPLCHAVAIPLPPPGYDEKRPCVFSIVLPTGATFLFQVFSLESARSWCSRINLWAARKSKEPLVAGLGSAEYGWTWLARARAMQMPPDPPDSADLDEWAPLGGFGRIVSKLGDADQLRAWQRTLQRYDAEIHRHASYQKPMAQYFESRRPHLAHRAMGNWLRRYQYLIKEYKRYQVYLEAIRPAAEAAAQRAACRRAGSAASAVRAGSVAASGLGLSDDAASLDIVPAGPSET